MIIGALLFFRCCDVSHASFCLFAAYCRLPLRANFVQLMVLGNHQNGRDSRIRLVQIFAAKCVIVFFLVLCLLLTVACRRPAEFTTLEYQQFAELR
jgi:hypothetical protein